jgi:hypothetical protein
VTAGDTLTRRVLPSAVVDRHLGARAEAHTAAPRLGHRGVPTLAFEGELFRDQGPIEDSEVALAEAGLERRDEPPSRAASGPPLKRSTRTGGP